MNQEIAGKYIHRKTNSHFIELKPDGTYFLFEGSSSVSGSYEVNGTEITIFGTDSTSRGKIQDGVIIDSVGDMGVRPKAGAEGTSDDPLPSMLWVPAVFRRDDFPWELIDLAGFIVLILIIFL